MKYLQRLLLGILVCLFLVQCSENSSEQPAYIRPVDEIPQHIKKIENLTVFSGDTEPAYSIELIPEQTYGKAGKSYITKVMNCVVDDNGRVIIVDFDKNKAYNFPNKLYAYNADGTYHTQIGRPGKGPGEYGFIFDMQAKAGKVIIFDITNKRLNIYNTNDYSYEGSILLERFKNTDGKAASGFESGYVRARMDGNYLVTFSESASSTGRTVNKYLLMDMDGHVLDFKPHPFLSVLSVRANSTPLSPPSVPLDFMGKTLRAMSDNDAIYSAWTQDFLIKKYDGRGVYKSAIYYPVKGSPFDLSDYTKQAGYNQQDVMNALDDIDEDLPEANPVIADMIVDDENRIWVAVPTGVQSETYEWWILKESGKLLAKLLLPPDQPIYDIQNGYLYSKETNEETGTEYAVKYRIALTEK